MAQRRMFSKTITNSSEFLMMPPTSQLLYFHFGMNADDDGFCEHFSIMRMTESKPDDLKVLHMKGFVQIFDDKVLVIKDWHENNYIQKDRYTPSRYLKIYKIDKIKILDTECIQDVSKMDTQVRLGKVRDRDIDQSFNRFWETYPRKVNKKSALISWSKIKPDDDLVVKILNAVERYKLTEQWKEDNGQFIPHPSTWLNQMRWEDEIQTKEKNSLGKYFKEAR